jgi:hypothetical protein
LDKIENIDDKEFIEKTMVYFDDKYEETQDLKNKCKAFNLQGIENEI